MGDAHITTEYSSKEGIAKPSQNIFQNFLVHIADCFKPKVRKGTK